MYAASTQQPCGCEADRCILTLGRFWARQLVAVSPSRVFLTVGTMSALQPVACEIVCAAFGATLLTQCITAELPSAAL